MISIVNIITIGLRLRQGNKGIPVIGIGGPVGSGKTALVEALCQRLRDRFSLAAVTNDIFTKIDAEILTKRAALPVDRILGVETGAAPIRRSVKMHPITRKPSMICCAGIRMWN